MLTLLLITLVAGCSGGGSDSNRDAGSSIDSQLVVDAQRASQAADDILQDFRSATNAELVEGLALSSTPRANESLNGPALIALYRSTFNRIVNERLFADRPDLYGEDEFVLNHYYDPFTANSRPLRYSEDREVRNYQMKTAQTLELLFSELESRLIQSIRLYRPGEPSPQAMFPTLMERGPEWIPANTVFFNFPFDEHNLDLAANDAMAVEAAFKAGISQPETEALNDPEFWSRYVSHGGLAEGAEVLASMLADRTFRPSTPIELFDAIIEQCEIDPVTQYGCVSEHTADRWFELIEEVFAAGQEALIAFPFRNASAPNSNFYYFVTVINSATVGDAETAALHLLLYIYDKSEPPPVADELTAEEGSMQGTLRIQRFQDLVSGFVSWDDGHRGMTNYFELQGRNVVVTGLGQYDDMIEQVSPPN
ncbi:MAG: hypothetical protein Hals2KO_15520 [Halioglobus sp.]